MAVLDRLFGFLPKQPPDWLIGFWTTYGAIFILSLFVQKVPADVVGLVVYWARLAVGLACLVVAIGLGWRRTHPS
jgi:hypothetical protein